MNLRQLIQSRNLTGTAAEIAAILNAKTEEHLDSELHTWAYLALRCGADKASQWHNVLVTSGLQWVCDQLAGAGIDLSAQQTVTMLDQLVGTGALSAEDAATIKALGRKHLSPYEQMYGEGSIATEDDVAVAIAPVEEVGIRTLVTVNYSSDGFVAHVNRQRQMSDGSNEQIEAFAAPTTEDPARMALFAAIRTAIDTYAAHAG